MKIIVIHHSADFDGIFCREIARKFIPDAELIGWDFGNPKVPVQPDTQYYVLDLSPECLDWNQTGHNESEQLIWIDHHKSSIEKWPATIPGYRIDGVAACRLAWQWFQATGRYLHQTTDSNRDWQWFNSHYPFPRKEDYVERHVSEPFAIRLAGEYDIWDKRDPDAELFQHGLRSQELTPDLWAMLMLTQRDTQAEGDLVKRLLNQGEAIQYARTQENASIIKDIGFDFVWEGLKFLACNAARYNSHLFTAGLKPEHDACFGFKWTGTKRNWSISLYHAPGKEHHDLSKIAVKYGGGGHRGACGFQTEKLPFLS